MSYGNHNTVESEKLHMHVQNANLVAPATRTSDLSGRVHLLTGQSGVTVIDLRAAVVDGKVALWLNDGQAEVGVGELDTLEITGPPAAEAVEFRIGDIVIGGEVAYKVSGQNEAGCSLGAWPRTEAETGICCVIEMPAGSTQVNWFKFTVSATPVQQGQPTPTPLDPLSVIKKGGAPG
jgi:hypothetical protein